MFASWNNNTLLFLKGPFRKQLRKRDNEGNLKKIHQGYRKGRKLERKLVRPGKEFQVTEIPEMKILK